MWGPSFTLCARSVKRLVPRANWRWRVGTAQPKWYMDIYGKDFNKLYRLVDLILVTHKYTNLDKKLLCLSVTFYGNCLLVHRGSDCSAISTLHAAVPPSRYFPRFNPVHSGPEFAGSSRYCPRFAKIYLQSHHHGSLRFAPVDTRQLKKHHTNLIKYNFTK